MASAGHLVSLHFHGRRGPTGWRRWCPSALRTQLPVITATGTGGLVDGATGAQALCVAIHPGHCTGGPTDGAAGACPPRALLAHDSTCHCWPCWSLSGIVSLPLPHLARIRLECLHDAQIAQHYAWQAHLFSPFPCFCPRPCSPFSPSPSALCPSPFVGPLCPVWAVLCALALCAGARTVHSNLRGTLVPYPLPFPLRLLSGPPCVQALPLCPLSLLVRARCTALCKAPLYPSLLLPLPPLSLSAPSSILPLLSPCSLPPGTMLNSLQNTLYDTHLITLSPSSLLGRRRIARCVHSPRMIPCGGWLCRSWGSWWGMLSWHPLAFFLLLHMCAAALATPILRKRRHEVQGTQDARHAVPFVNGR